MSIGYACIALGVRDTAQRTTIAKNASPAKLRELIEHNLAVLGRILDYNAAQDIRLFRVSSDIVPFGSSPVNTLDWAAEFAPQLAALGQKARGYGMRLSMHPGQYTVLNSPDADVVSRAVEDLRYHNRFMDALGLDAGHKIILHIGGVYGNKAAATGRFEAAYEALDEGIRRRLILENDDKLYTARDVLAIAQRLGAPMVFDNLHHAIHHEADDTVLDAEWIDMAGATWGPADGRQKVHYSQQAAGGRPGAHSGTVYIAPFLQWYQSLGENPPDVMLEVKDKNLSAVKCVNCTAEDGRITRLEAEWARYKYTVLEHAPDAYAAIRALLKDKAAYPAEAFYNLLEGALDTPVTVGHAVNAAQHVWGYFKKGASPAEAASFQKAITAYKEGKAAGLTRAKSLLAKLAAKTGQAYLLDGYYFLL